jgi:cell division control protein 6
MVTLVKYLPKQSLAVLSAIIKLHEKNQDDIQTGDVYAYYEKLCTTTGLKSLTQRRVSDLVAELDMLAVINARVISKGRFGRTREIRMLLEDRVLEKIKETLRENYLL